MASQEPRVKGGVPVPEDERFDVVPPRTDIDALKWGVGPDELPMWVADMDFATAPAIRDALERRVANGTFGYTVVPERYRRAVSAWWSTRHGLTVDPRSVIFATGVVPAISSMVRSLTNVAEKVVVQPPVYDIFYNSIVNNGRRVLESPLAYDARTRAYSIDFEDLERKLSDPLATLMIVCNPHNPTGNVWSKDELARIGELCAANGAHVISDEVHCDITAPGVSHVPFASASDTCRRISVTCCSPSKAFNVAGLQSAYVFLDDPATRHRVERGLNTDEVAEPNDFAICSTVAAYERGAAWLDGMRRYVDANRRAVEDAIARSDVGAFMRAVPSRATYLVWIDCSAFVEDADDFVSFARRQTGLVLSSGSIYGTGGRRFVRMNVATSRKLVLDGVGRLLRAVRGYIDAAGGVG